MSSRFAAGLAIALAVTSAAALVVFVAWPSPSTPDFDAGSDARQADDASRVVPAITAPSLGPSVTYRSANPADVAAASSIMPQRIDIPAAQITLPVVAKGLAPDGSMALPIKAGVAAWYQHGGLPGDLDRAALIASHIATDVDGVGPFSRLGQLVEGDAVLVTLSDGSRAEFAVVKRERISKSVVDYEAITAQSEGMLVLVTCGGEYDAQTRHYEDNVIVWAASTEVP